MNYNISNILLSELLDNGKFNFDYTKLINSIKSSPLPNFNYISIAYCPNNIYTPFAYVSMISTLSSKSTSTYISFYIITSTLFSKSNMDFINSLDYTMFVKAFIIGGLLCVFAQILIDKTKLTPARILVLYVTLGSYISTYLNAGAHSDFDRQETLPVFFANHPEFSEDMYGILYKEGRDLTWLKLPDTISTDAYVTTAYSNYGELNNL